MAQASMLFSSVTLLKSSYKSTKSNSDFSYHKRINLHQIANLKSPSIFNNSSLINNSRLLGGGWKQADRTVKFSSSSKPIEKDEEETPVQSFWVDSVFPKKVLPYVYLGRWYRFIGTWLCGWPCMWSLAFAANPGSLPDLKMMALFFVVSFITASIGCTIDDYIDKDLDPKVERTKGRPLASGALTNTQALCFLGIQLLVCYAVLLPLNELSRLLWISSLPFIFVYPFMKRIVYWPQAHLGLICNWGVLYSWTAVKGSLDLAVVFPLFVAGIFWTLVYDTIYAHQDKEDDVKVGIKSTALLFGDSTKLWTTGFGAASIGSLALAGFNADIGWPFYVLLAAALGQMAWLIWNVDLSKPADCMETLLSNRWFGVTVFSAILFGRVFS